MNAARKPADAATLQRIAGLKDRVHFLRAYLIPLVERGLVRRTIPSKPRSRFQMYVTTPAGRAWLAKSQRHG